MESKLSATTFVLPNSNSVKGDEPLSHSKLLSTSEAFLQALTIPAVKSKYLDSTIRTWKSRVNKQQLSLDFMVEFLLENGYELKQTMTWSKHPDHTMAVLSEKSIKGKQQQGNNDKTDVGKMLYAVRKELYKDLISKWFEWSVAQYAADYPARKQDLNESTFNQMTYGRYISKESMLFAVKVLKEGKRLLREYEEQIKSELESI